MSIILQELAAGRIDAAEAARRIDELRSPAPQAETVEEPAADEPGQQPSEDGNDEDVWAAATDRPQRATYTTESFPAAGATPADSPSAPDEKSTNRKDTVRDKPVNTGGVERISVRAVGRRVRIVGEPAVATVSADGPHVLRRNGSVLEISSDGDMGSSLDGFSILRATRSLDDIRSLGLGKELFLRVNPGIIIDAEVTAGSLNTEGVPHLGKIRVTAGGAKLLDVAQIEDALIQAGQATIKGAITVGRSRIRAESGSLSIQLADESNVTVTGDSQLGKVAWSGGHTGAGDEVVMGNGSARLDVEVVMGHAQIKIGSTPKSDAGAA
ncbi:MAG: hypothetical protein AVDCRST_MAG75-651 [uncultured Propionibacteriaceae bacterium]|uniref:Adhesin domain-containing protein n=1 Tax=uncultured Propionibacteriaceae bacterium TaxID=257457 RepID=A0A6J4N427_9ACTN|nr:MAG: hypothetical protein AVDCRST_MAG75-651 [uncultured Propionibacteriaceae bacterium]